jgi:hypothetical protein
MDDRKRARIGAVPSVRHFSMPRLCARRGGDWDRYQPKSGSWVIVYRGRIGGICWDGKAKAEYRCAPSVSYHLTLDTFRAKIRCN